MQSARITNPIVQRNKYDVLTSIELTRLKEWIRKAEGPRLSTDQARQLLRPRARRRTQSPLHDARRRFSACRSQQRPCLPEGSKNHAPWRPFRHSACGTRKKFAAGRVRRAPRCCHIRPDRLPRVSQTSHGCVQGTRARQHPPFPPYCFSHHAGPGYHRYHYRRMPAYACVYLYENIHITFNITQ